MSRIIFLDPNDVQTTWHRLRELFKEAIKKGHGEYELADILDQACRGRIQLAYIENEKGVLMALAFEVKNYPAMRVLYVTAMAGTRMAELFEKHYKEVGVFAKSLGAVKFEAAGSDSMIKMLSDSGWYEINRTVRFDI